MARHMQSGDTGLSDLAEQAFGELIKEQSDTAEASRRPEDG